MSKHKDVKKPRGRYIKFETLNNIIRQVYSLGGKKLEITGFKIENGQVIGCYLGKHEKW